MSHYTKIIPYSLGAALTETSAWLCFPLIALTLDAQGYSATVAGSVSALPAAGIVGMSLVLPKVTHRLGVAATLYGGSALLIAALAVLMAAAATKSLWLWSGGAIAVGVATAIRWILTDGIVNHVTIDEYRGRVVSFHETIRSSALGFGPMIVAWSAGDAHAALMTAAIMAALGVLCTLPLTKPDVSQGPARIADLVRGVRLVPAAYALAFLSGVLEGAAASTIPLYAVAAGLTAGTAAALAAASGYGNILGQLPCGWSVDRWGVRPTARVLFVLICGSLIGVHLLIGSPSWAMVMMVLFGATGGSLFTLAVLDAASARERAGLLSVLSAISVIYTLGALIGPALGGAVLDAGPAVAVPSTFVALTALAAILHAVLHRRA